MEAPCAAPAEPNPNTQAACVAFAQRPAAVTRLPAVRPSLGHDEGRRVETPRRQLPCFARAPSNTLPYTARCGEAARLCCLCRVRGPPQDSKGPQRLTQGNTPASQQAEAADVFSSSYTGLRGAAYAKQLAEYMTRRPRTRKSAQPKACEEQKVPYKDHLAVLALHVEPGRRPTPS